MTEKQTPEEIKESFRDDRQMPVARDQRRELAAFLHRHALEITQRWLARSAEDTLLSPPLLLTSDSEEAAPSVLALVEHLDASGPDVHLPAHVNWLRRWHGEGLSRANARDHFHALRDLTTETLRDTKEIAEHDKPPLMGLLEAAVRNLRLETSEFETRQLLAEALEARNQFEDLFETSADAVVIEDLQSGEIVASNPAATTLMGIERRQLQGMKLEELQADLPALVDAQVNRDGDSGAAPATLEMGRPDGSTMVVEINSSRVDYQGRTCVQVLLRDITERMRFGQELERRAEQLQSELSGRLEEMAHLRAFLENIINALPARLLVLNETLTVLHANSAYLRQRRLPRESVEGKSIAAVFPDSLLEEAGLREAMLNTLKTGDRVRWAGFRQATSDHTERILNIGLDPCPGVYGERNLLVSIEDVTERHRQLYERSILHQIVQAMLGMRDLPRLLHAILTGITAGGGVGLGFNRATLMLADEETGMLKAEMAVGPEDADHAARIWSELSGHRTLTEFLSEYDRLPPPNQRPLHRLVERLSFPMSDTSILPMLAAAGRETIHVLDAANDPRVPHDLYEGLDADEFVIAPLVVQNKIIGVAIADNSINHQRINQTDVQLLTALANHAALSIDSARVYAQAQKRADELSDAYAKLESATERLVRSESLAAIGEITAIVAHEIRNPLSTIGGFARMLARRADDPELVRRNARIVTEEVGRLETILGELLDFSKPTRPKFASCSLHEVVASSVVAVQGRLGSAELQVEVPEDLPPAPMDCGQMQQVISNLIINAADAMGDQGIVTVRGWQDEQTVRLAVSDTGQGIPESHLEHIFDTFFTTKPTGTGLGLALSKKVVDDHGASLEVESKVGEGTTFTITFHLDAQPPPTLDEITNPEAIEPGKGTS